MFTYTKIVYIDSLKDIIISFSISIKQFDKTCICSFSKDSIMTHTQTRYDFSQLSFWSGWSWANALLEHVFPQPDSQNVQWWLAYTILGLIQVRRSPIPRRATLFLTRGAAHYLVRARQSSINPDIVPRRWVIYFSFRNHVRQCILYIFNKAFNTNISSKVKVSHMHLTITF